MQVVDFTTEKIKPYKKNNRVHSDEQVAHIAKSIKQFGFNQPVVLDETNTILVGHGRWLAAQWLGLEQIPVLKVANLDESAKKAYRVLDNKLQNDSDWDWENLVSELSELQKKGFELEEWGLDTFLAAGEKLEYDSSSLEKEAESYLTNTIRQIVLHYEQETHRTTLDRLEAAAGNLGVTKGDNATTLLKLLDHYERTVAN